MRPSMMVVNVVVEAPQPTAAAPASVPAPAPVPREAYLPPPERDRPSIIPPPMAAARYAAEARGVDPVQARAGLIVDVRV